MLKSYNSVVQLTNPTDMVGGWISLASMHLTGLKMALVLQKYSTVLASCFDPEVVEDDKITIITAENNY